MGEKEKISTSIRLDADLQMRVDDKLHALKKAGQKMSFQAAFHEALEQWVSGTPSSGSSKAVPAIDTHASQHHNAQVEKLKRLEESKLEIIDKLGRIVTEEAGILREIKANPRSGGRVDSPGRRARGSG